MSVILSKGDIYGALIDGSPKTISVDEQCFDQALATLQNMGNSLTQKQMVEYLQNMPQDIKLRIEHQVLSGLDDYRIYLGEQNIGMLSKTSNCQHSFTYSSITSTSNDLFLNISCLAI